MEVGGDREGDYIPIATFCCFYIALFSILELTHCARKCDYT